MNNKELELQRDKIHTIEGVAHAVLDNLGESTHHLNRLINFAVQGYKDWNLNIAPAGLSVVEKTLNSAKQIDWPNDMIDWNKVGVRCGDLIKVFVQDDTMPILFDKDEEGNDVAHKKCPHINDAPTTIDQIFFYPYYDGFESLRQYYGLPVEYNYKGYFKSDYKKRQFSFRDTVDGTQKIYMEYLSEGINYCGNTVIHPYCWEPLRRYVHWQVVEYDKRASRSEKNEKERQFDEKYDEMLLNMVDITFDDIRDVFRKQFTLVVQN